MKLYTHKLKTQSFVKNLLTVRHTVLQGLYPVVMISYREVGEMVLQSEGKTGIAIFKVVPWPLTSRYLNGNGSVGTHKSPPHAEDKQYKY